MSKMAEFGGANSDSYSLDTIIGWLETLIEDEAELCEESSNKHRKARLDRAYDGLTALEEVSDWTPRLTKYHAKQS